MYKKMCCTCKVAFLLIRPIVVFHRSPALPSPLSITRFYILFEQTINIIESFAFSPGQIHMSLKSNLFQFIFASKHSNSSALSQ